MDDYEEMLMTKAAWHYYFEGITNNRPPSAWASAACV